MRGDVSVCLASPVEIISFAHIVSEHSLRRPVGRGPELFLAVVVRGRVDVQSAQTQIVLHANEAFLVEVGPSERVFVSYDEAADVCFFRFRRRRSVSSCNEVISIPEHAQLTNPGTMTDLLRVFDRHARGRREPRRTLPHLLVLILCEIRRSPRHAYSFERAEDGHEIIASRVDACIAGRFREPISSDDIARSLHYNPHYLERVYRAERGISMREAIQRRRMREARAQLVLQRAAGISKIARMCGFSDPGYFRRRFKKETGMTPNEYRVTRTENAS